MLLGFISLLIAIGQGYIEERCIPIKFANTMLPCHMKTKAEADESKHRRRLLSNEHRFLGSGGVDPNHKCKDVSISRTLFIFLTLHSM